MEKFPSLIHQKKFNLIIDSGLKNFHVAYAHYRLFNFKKSLKILHNLKQTKRIKILSAQNYFYLGEFSRAYELFSEYPTDPYIQFNMNCALYFSKNRNILPEKYSIYSREEINRPAFKFSNSSLATEDQFNSSFQYLNSRDTFIRYLEENSKNPFIANQLCNLNRDSENMNSKNLLASQKLIFQKNCGEKILIKNRRLFQNNYTFRKFCRRKNILKINEMEYVLGAFLDLKAGKDQSKNLQHISGEYKKIFTVLFNREEERYKDIYQIITNL